MAQVRFYGMLLDFEFVKTNYANTNFGTFILQPYMADAEKWRDEFTLLIYALDTKGSVIEKKDLKINKKFIYKAHDRVELGNIQFSKKQAKKFIDEDNNGNKIIFLDFQPYQFGDYAAYKVFAIGTNKRALALTEEELKPSPPAPPEN